MVRLRTGRDRQVGAQALSGAARTSVLPQLLPVLPELQRGQHLNPQVLQQGCALRGRLLVYLHSRVGQGIQGQSLPPSPKCPSPLRVSVHGRPPKIQRYALEHWLSSRVPGVYRVLQEGGILAVTCDALKRVFDVGTDAHPLLPARRERIGMMPEVLT